MVAIPGGTFTEQEATPREVTVQDFEIDRTEVTAGQYRQCVQAGCCQEARGYEGGCNYPTSRNDHPINCVMHAMAEAFCEWAGKRLPTQQEWEYAALGPEQRAYPWGAGNPTVLHANACGVECNQNSTFGWNDRWAKTAPVGAFAAGATPLGLEDMAANVAEWTAYVRCAHGSDPCNNCPPGQTCENPCNTCVDDLNPTGYVVQGGHYLATVDASLDGTNSNTFAGYTVLETIGFRCAR
jgi:formylglycine-generating enzyme required for sulfatase activity